jgi:hypothetical protein
VTVDRFEVAPEVAARTGADGDDETKLRAASDAVDRLIRFLSPWAALNGSLPAMDAARIAFVFDRDLDPDEIDLDDEDQLYDLVAGTFPALDEGQIPPRMVVAKMILTDDPPVMWETVERLAADGVARGDIWSGLALTVLVALRDVMDGDTEAMSPERLAGRLAQLPVPGWDDVYDAIERTVGDRTDLRVDALADAVRQRFGFGDADAGQVVLDQVVDDL